MKLNLLFIMLLASLSLRAIEIKDYRLTDSQSLQGNIPFVVQGTIFEKPLAVQGLNHEIRFPKNDVLKWPNSLKIILPTSENDTVKAYKSKEVSSSFVVYQFSFIRNTVSGGSGKAKVSTLLPKIFKLPIEAVYSPFGQQQKVFTLKNSIVHLESVEIISSNQYYIFIKRELKNVFLTHQSYLVPGMKVMSREYASNE